MCIFLKFYILYFFPLLVGKNIFPNNINIRYVVAKCDIVVHKRKNEDLHAQFCITLWSVTFKCHIYSLLLPLWLHVVFTPSHRHLGIHLGQRKEWTNSVLLFTLKTLLKSLLFLHWLQITKLSYLPFAELYILLKKETDCFIHFLWNIKQLFSPN
jgi:hypothetical protein